MGSAFCEIVWGFNVTHRITSLVAWDWSTSAPVPASWPTLKASLNE